MTDPLTMPTFAGPHQDHENEAVRAAIGKLNAVYAESRMAYGDKTHRARQGELMRTLRTTIRALVAEIERLEATR